MKTIFSILVLLCSCTGLSGQLNIDSLWNVWNDKNKAENTRLEAIDQITINLLSTHADSAVIYAQLQYDFAATHENKSHTAKALNTLGDAYSKKGDFTSAIDYWKRSLSIVEDLKDQKAIAATQFKIGAMLNNHGQFSKALDYHMRSLKISEALGDKTRMAETLNHIGFVYDDSGDYDRALDYYNRNLNIREEIKDSVGMAWALNNIALIYKRQNDLSKAILFNNKSMDIRKRINDQRGLAASLNNIANILKNQGNYLNAIDHYTESLKISEKIGDEINMANVLNNIGEIHIDLSNYTKAIEYFNRSLIIYRELGNKKYIALALNNLGIVYTDNREFAKAIETLELSLKIKEEISDESGMAAPINNIGNVYMHLKDYDKALNYYIRSLKIEEKLDNKTGQAISFNGIAGLYITQKEYAKSIPMSIKALKLAKEQGVILTYKEAAKNLYKAYRQTKQYDKAIEFNEIYITLQDSIERSETQRALLRQEYQYDYEKQAMVDSLEFAKKEAVKDLEIVKHQSKLSRQRTALFASGGGLLLIMLLAYSIFKGKKRSDELLLNILPAEVAKELKQKGYADAKEFEQTTILFTDFIGFTAISERMSPENLVKEIDTCFKAFDRIIYKYGIEKIKTIGDAYMAAGGLHIPRTSEPKDVIKAAIEMQDFIVKRKVELDFQNLPAFEMRVGVHTGPVVAGIVGIKKFQYDIWGDTVNIASRMESSGEAGKVNISENTFQLIRDFNQFSFTNRGKIEAKGKGLINMYFVGLSDFNSTT